MEYETARVHGASHWLNRPGDGMDEVNATATAQGPSAPIAAEPSLLTCASSKQGWWARAEKPIVVS